jgi:uncharacterized protein YbjQ (UPF0145 family)
MVYCLKCGAQNYEDATYCMSCGELLESQQLSDFKVVTTPTIPGYKITEVIGIVSGLSPRTRGIGGVITGMIQSIGGGEITAFVSEIEKSKVEAISRAIQKAKGKGANAIVGLDMETSDMGGKSSFITLVSATGTAVVVEQE